MSFTSFLLNISPYALLLLMVFVFAGISGGLTFLFRKIKKKKNLQFSSEMTGDFFALLGGIYGLLLGFVVLLVYDSFNDTAANATQEQSIARSLYREIRYYPDTMETAPLTHAYLRFVHSVIEEEFPQMEKLQPFSAHNRIYLNDVYREMGKLNFANTKTAGMMVHLNDLAKYRGLRQLGAASDIPLVIWLPLIFGYLVLLVCSLFLNIESVQMHISLNALLGTFIGLVIYIIITVNHPFSGKMKIEPEMYRMILDMNRVDK